MKKEFSTTALFRASYTIMKDKRWEIIKKYAVIMSTFMLINALGQGNMLITFVLSSLFAYFSVIFVTAYAEKGEFHFNDLFETITFKRFAYFFCASLLSSIAIFGGLILCVIPGIIALVQLLFVKFILVEREMSPMQALKASAKMTKGYRWKLFEFTILCILINAIGAIVLLVGLFFTIPFTVIALQQFYRKLETEGVSAKEGETITVAATPA